MKNMKTRKLVILAIALIAIIATSVATFAYWDSLQDDDTVVLAAGEGVTLTATANAYAEGNLVPNDDAIIMKAGDVKSITVTYQVELDKGFTSGVTLNVAVSNITVGGVAVTEDADVDVINIDYTESFTMVSDTATEVTFIVTMDEPATQAAYNKVANKEIKFDVTFTAVVA